MHAAGQQRVNRGGGSRWCHGAAGGEQGFFEGRVRLGIGLGIGLGIRLLGLLGGHGSGILCVLLGVCVFVSSWVYPCLDIPVSIPGLQLAFFEWRVW